MTYQKIVARSERLSAVARPVFKRIVSISNAALYRATLAKLSQEYARNHSVERLIDAIYSSRSSFFTVRPLQVKEELGELLALVSSLHPRTLLEIGTARGGTLYLLTRVAGPDAVITSIDLPEGPYGGGYPTWKIPIYRSFAKGQQKIALVRADSHDFSSLEKVKSILDGEGLDFLFIDGDHTYQGVRRDYEMYSPLTRPGSLIAFHDIVRHPSEAGVHVNEFWNEVKHSYEYREIVRNWNQSWGGIGVLFVGKRAQQNC